MLQPSVQPVSFLVSIMAALFTVACGNTGLKGAASAKSTASSPSGPVVAAPDAAVPSQTTGGTAEASGARNAAEPLAQCGKEMAVALSDYDDGDDDDDKGTKGSSKGNKSDEMTLDAKPRCSPEMAKLPVGKGSTASREKDD